MGAAAVDDSTSDSRSDGTTIDGTTGLPDFERRAAAIERSVNEIAGHLNAQHARLVDEVVALLSDTRMWQGPGVWTMQQWLAWRTGISTTTARRVVAIAERIDDLPECCAAFRRGELSLEQMAAIAGRAPAWTDAQMCTLGRSMTVQQIQHTVAKYPFDDTGEAPADGGSAEPSTDDAAADSSDREASDADPSDPDASEASLARSMSADEYCSLLWNDDGSFRLSAATDPETGMIVEAALREARDRLFHDGHPDVTWLDALREIAQRSLDAIADPARRRRFTTSLFLDTDGAMSDTSQWRLPDAVRDHVLCDGLIVPTWREDGLPVSVGRRQHIVPDRTRRIVEQRDRGRCRVPGCTARHFLEIHHIIHWLEGGRTETPNLIALCPHHHRLHHRGLLGIAGDADEPDGVLFTNEHGRPIAQSGATPIPPSGQPPPPANVYRHPTGERLDTNWILFNRSPVRHPSVKAS